jgi:hypothetical protein
MKAFASAEVRKSGTYFTNVRIALMNMDLLSRVPFSNSLEMLSLSFTCRMFSEC